MGMKIALIGASGFVGSAILKEAVSRHHDVVGLVRNPEKVEKSAHVTATKIDVNDTKALTSAITDADVVIASYVGPRGDADIYTKHRAGSASIVEAVKAAGKRVLVIGGAGSLYAPDGSQFVDSDQFPKEYREEARAARDVLGDIKKETALDWTFLSPAFVLKPGERTGKYRLGLDNPVFNDKGESSITAADLAIAVLDEIEKPKHSRKRFTVGY
jgi:putative NADH-flavin reductase